MNDQVLNIERMQHLKELGVDTSKASMYWVRIIRPACRPNEMSRVMLDWFLCLNPSVMHTPLDKIESIPTFAFQDIWDLLPKELDLEPFAHKWYLSIDYQHNRMTYAYTDKRRGYYLTDPAFDIGGKKLIDAAYNMLCWVIENGYIETKKE